MHAESTAGVQIRPFLQHAVHYPELERFLCCISPSAWQCSVRTATPATHRHEVVPLQGLLCDLHSPSDKPYSGRKWLAHAPKRLMSSSLFAAAPPIDARQLLARAENLLRVDCDVRRLAGRTAGRFCGQCQVRGGAHARRIMMHDGRVAY